MALNPLTVTLGISNVSFVAQVVDWIPEVLYQVISAAFHHKGFSFIRIIQRCPEWLPKQMDPWMHDPQRVLLLHHENGLEISPALAKVYTKMEEHDPANMNRAREIASSDDPIPVGILYRDDDIPCYEDVRHDPRLRTAEMVKNGLNAELDKLNIWPEGATHA